MYPKDEGYSQQGSFRFSPGHLGLSDKKWNYDYCEYLPDMLNLKSDFQSNLKTDSSEWKLNLKIFRKVYKTHYTPSISRFARISHQVPMQPETC